MRIFWYFDGKIYGSLRNSCVGEDLLEGDEELQDTEKYIILEYII